jgi:hypothetical protein
MDASLFPVCCLLLAWMEVTLLQTDMDDDQAPPNHDVPDYFMTCWIIVQV